MPVDQAAQDVQHSADGYAYQQWAGTAGLLAGDFTATSPGRVSCWYTPGGTGKADLAGVVKQLTSAFGRGGKNGATATISTDRSAHDKKGASVAVVRVQRSGAWLVASWLVAYAQQYGIRQVRYAGYEWNAGNDGAGWQRVPSQSPASGSIVAA
jgi:hypothetical protein